MYNQNIGKVVSVDNATATLEALVDLQMLDNLVEKFIIFASDKKIVGKILATDFQNIKVEFVGSFEQDRFSSGLTEKPKLGEEARLADSSEVYKVLLGMNLNSERGFILGKMPLYDNIPVHVSLNRFFSNHFAIFGNSGSGKSWGVARIFQNLFQDPKGIPRNSSIFIFDAYGEYEDAFVYPNSEFNFKRYMTDVNQQNNNLVKIPFWLLGIDDIALLLNAEDPTQLPIIEKSLRLAQVFAKDKDEAIIHKNNIIAKSILEILYSGKNASQLRDQIVAMLTQFNTETLNLDTKIVQLGYTRELRKCLVIDKDGKMQDIQLVTDFFNSYVKDDLTLEMPVGKIKYTLKNFQEAFAFALLSEGILKSDKVYDKANIMKVRLDSLINSEYAKYFDVEEYISKLDFIKSLLLDENGHRAQIININLNYVDDRFAKVLCKIYAKFLFDFEIALKRRGSIPIHVLLEEAHRYVQNDSDTYVLGYNIFDRIAKEGRKYGLILGMISQRPSELSETAISQCSNFLIFKMLHPKDVDYIKNSVPEVSLEVIEKLKSLQPGSCIAFGGAFNFPLITKLDPPNPIPKSSNVNIKETWY